MTTPDPFDYAAHTARNWRHWGGEWVRMIAAGEPMDPEQRAAVLAYLVSVAHSVCANCGQRIREACPGVWDHPDNAHHTVCDWHEDMPPTDRVARPVI